MYKEDGDGHFLTGQDLTAYFSFIAKLAHLSISDAELMLILTHSVRVYACVLLHEAGKDGSYIKLRLH